MWLRSNRRVEVLASGAPIGGLAKGGNWWTTNCATGSATYWAPGGCPDALADVMEVVAPVVAERDQLRAVVEYSEAQRARQRQMIEGLQETERRLRQTLRDIRGR